MLNLRIVVPTSSVVVPNIRYIQHFLKGFKYHSLKVYVFVVGVAGWMPYAGCAQSPSEVGTVERAAHTLRLSDWLLEEMQLRQEQNKPDIFLPGISWNSPAEVVQQTEQKNVLLKQVDEFNKTSGYPAKNQALYTRIQALPVTGRVVLPEQDPRWLQLNMQLNPILNSSKEIVAPSQITTVSVLREDGSVCTLSHRSDVEATYYIRHCLQQEVDQAWLIQANGEVQRVGVADWNASKQDRPSPGAWIWAPLRQSDWPEKTSQLLANFIATQGPSGTVDVSQRFSDEMTKSYLPTNVDESLNQKSQDLQLTASDWGTIGLLQTPTARMEKAGHLSFTYSNTYPYTRGTIMLQPLNELEFGFRYVSISNRLYGPVNFSGTQSDKDKSIDATIHLREESAYWPELAVGFRDLAGTGLFSGEYLVGSKRTGNFDWSLGLGWGYLGQAGTIKNPFSFISSKFNNRDSNFGKGGKLSAGTYFHGPAAVFGGVQYQTPWEPLILKLELDGNNYQNEPWGDVNKKRSSPFNVGVVYRWTPNIDLSVGVERGNTALLGFTLHQNMGQLFTPKISMPRSIPVVDKPIGAEAAVSTISMGNVASPSVNVVATPSEITNLSYANTISEIESQTHWRIREIRHEDNNAWVVVVAHAGGYFHEHLDRLVAVLHRDAPNNITSFRIRYEEYGVVTGEHDVNRKDWMRQKTQWVSPSEQRDAAITLASEVPAQKVEKQSIIAAVPEKRFDGGLGLNYAQTLGGPDAFWLYSFAAEATAKVRLWKGAFVSGNFDARLIDNYDKFKTTGSSELPRVRTYLREYVTTSRYTMPRLQATQIVRLSDSQFLSTYGGYLETMFAGVGGEYLWRPTNSRLAIGLDVNRVQQRAFEQNFNLMDYKTTTGHLTAYWDTGWEHVLATISAGKYLAGDKGMTVDLRKIFKNGVTMGVFATKTDVSSQQFGEGSFNKGIYITFPFDALLTSYSDSKGTVLWTPLTRDGGAKLNRAVNLYDYTNVKDLNGLDFSAQ